MNTLLCSFPFGLILKWPNRKTEPHYYQNRRKAHDFSMAGCLPEVLGCPLHHTVGATRINQSVQLYSGSAAACWFAFSHKSVCTETACTDKQPRALKEESKTNIHFHQMSRQSALEVQEGPVVQGSPRHLYQTRPGGRHTSREVVKTRECWEGLTVLRRSTLSILCT